MRYKLKKEIVILDKVIPIGTILTIDSDMSIYEFSDGFKQELQLSYVSTISDKIIEPVVDIKELPLSSDEDIKKYRPQLDVTCSLTKLKELEIILKSNIEKVLYK